MASEINTAENRASAFQTLLPLPDCNTLIKCEDSTSSLISPTMMNNSVRVPTAMNNSSSVSSCNSSNVNGNGNINHSNNSANSQSPKMGSRRIFTPQFKLQVLESYRNDSDCKGNQRATARKYNIHRRQIQKWLQCETNLRSSVANVNQNSVKHQFHNISHPQHHQHQHQHQQQHASAPLQSAQRLALPLAVPSTSRSGANNGYSHHHHHHLHNHPQVPLDAARQTLQLNSLNVPSMPARVTSSNTSSAQGVLAANLAAAVAVAIATSSSQSTSTTAVSPLRPTAIGGTSVSTVGGSSVSSMSPSLLHSHHHHHHHYPLSPYARSPVAAPVPVSVPMLPHHIAPPHHQHYPYHNLSPHTHGHAIPLSHQPSAFLPTACLPVNVLSAVAAAASPPANAATNATGMTEKATDDNCTDANANVRPKLCQPLEDTTTTDIKSMVALPETMNLTTAATTPAAAVLMGTNSRSFIHESEYESMYKGAMYVETERMRDANCKNFFQQPLYQYADQDFSNTSIASPMDLSIGSRRKSASLEIPRKSLLLNAKDVGNTECHSQENSGNDHSQSNDHCTNTQIVDLTFRKRKVVTEFNTSVNDNKQPQKLAKRLEEKGNEGNETPKEECTLRNITQKEGDDDNKTDGIGCGCDDDDDVEIEVEVDVGEKHLSSKPVKLFKPYLLDDPDDCSPTSKSNVRNSASNSVMNEQREPIIWSNHPAFSYDSNRASSLLSPTAEKHTFPNGSPYFLGSKASSPQSVLSTTSALSLSPTSFPLRCPKGSPVSGYESSSSTCSERDDTFSVTDNRSYTLDFQMHTVCENKVTTQPMHIRDWLDQDVTDDTNTPPLARASIALYA